jgi:hypothetical protein
MTESRLIVLLAWKIAEILSKSRPGDDCTPFAQDVILEVAAWLRKRNVRVRASVEIAGDLEREINQAQPSPSRRGSCRHERKLPTREEAVALYTEVMVAHDCQTLGDMAETFSHAVLARWGRPAAGPEKPTVMEIIALADEIEAEGLGQVDLVRRALARWGRPPQ